MSLADLAGSTAVLYFYPKDDTSGCTAEACEFRDLTPDYDAAGARVIGVSPDPVTSHVIFRDKHGLPFTLLSDPDHAVAEAYGVWVREVHVRPDVHGRRAQHVRDRPRRDDRAGALQGEAQGPRRLGAGAGGVASRAVTNPHASPVPQRRLAILAYGSLLYRLSPGLESLVVGREPCRTPFPVEYGRAARSWGGGPVLVPHPRGGSVDGALLLLAEGVELGAAVQLLAEREGLDGARGVVQVEVPGDRLVLSASLPRNLPEPDMAPGALARRAVKSARTGPRNGVAYLRGAVEAGVVHAPHRAVLRARCWSSSGRPPWPRPSGW